MRSSTYAATRRLPDECAPVIVRRSASLAVLENAHLLRLTQLSFERLDRRSPRISAVLYRNLSRIMAQRVINTTELIH